jgi:hypothetical protein
MVLLGIGGVLGRLWLGCSAIGRTILKIEILEGRETKGLVLRREGVAVGGSHGWIG